LTISEEIAIKTKSISFHQVPRDVIEEAKYHLLDSLGIILAASAQKESQNILNVARIMSAKEESWCAGSDKKFSAHISSLVNGTLLHSLEYDDTHTESIIHASSVVVPVGLAVGEACKSSGKDVLTSLILGWESLIRFGLAAPNAFQKNGFHTTSVCGPFSAVLITAFLKNLSIEKIVAALGNAGSFSSGIFEYAKDGAPIKQTHPGWAAHNGIIAAIMAEQSIRGPYTVFEGEYGFYSTFARSNYGRLEDVWNSFGEKWLTTELSYKPYPSCHFNHAFIDCVKELLNEGLNYQDVDKIICKTAKEIVPIVMEPLQKKRQPQTGYEAKFSLPYAIASILIDREISIQTFTDQMVVRPEITEFMKKVDYEIKLESNFPESFSGEVDVFLKSGEKLTKELKYNRGGPRNPLTKEDIIDKFKRNSSLLLSDNAIDELLERVLTIEKEPNVLFLNDLVKQKSANKW
jgi:2-methylcitrate dehydratase PrpD